MRKPWRFWPVLILLCGCAGTDHSAPPPGSTNLEVLGSGWCAFEWRGHRFLRHSYLKNGRRQETIHLCHCNAGVLSSPEKEGGR